MLISSLCQPVNAAYMLCKPWFFIHPVLICGNRNFKKTIFPVPSKNLKMCEKRCIFSLSVNVSQFFFFYVDAGLQFGCKEGNYFYSTIFDVIAGGTLTMWIQYN